MVSRVRRRFPTREELDLWARVTRHDEPLERRRRAAPAEPPALEGAVPPVPVLAKAPENAADGRGAPLQRLKAASTAKTKLDPPPPAPFDPHIGKRIARGRHAIDARLDLHGMRQQDAYLALRRFLATCQASGFRHVLIITGKGESLSREENRDFWTSEQRGVLRRLVPHWLAEPGMRLHVVSYTESALKHGGSGALYVTIRKGPRARS